MRGRGLGVPSRVRLGWLSGEEASLPPGTRFPSLMIQPAIVAPRSAPISVLFGPRDTGRMQDGSPECLLMKRP